MSELKVAAKYQPEIIENKWVESWDKEQWWVTPKRTEKSKKAYVLGMFPYPSGEGLHTGHGRIFTAVDVMSRYFRMNGYEVLCPTGWDAFGLPAENAAIKAHKNPVDMVPHNEANFKRQMMMLGLSYDWNRTFSTTDPAYYKWTQWLFLKLYSIKNDKRERLVYRKEVPINWCPFCKTGLANEEVMSDGTHERCGNQVTQKLMPQWNMRITDYADRLLSDLDITWEDEEGKKHAGLDWPEGILAMQRNWIGKKEGVMISHKVVDMSLTFETFSAYPAWLFADTFIVVAPEHPIVRKLVKVTDYEGKVDEFISEHKTHTKEELESGKLEKRGVFTGRYAEDPFNKGRKMPIWLANFALMDFGTGMIRCSAHDIRDYEFALKYQIPLAEVVERIEAELPVNAHDNKGRLKDSGPFSGKEISSELINEMTEWIIEQKIGRRETTYHLRDWVFSRQRYWGEPFPLVYCEKCGDDPTSHKASRGEETLFETTLIDGKKYAIVPLPEDQLPLKLPYLQSYEPTETGESPLSRIKEWVETTCPNCGGPARRETDTMPNWAGSCWYFFRFADPGNSKEVWSEKAINGWLPVDWYLGGAEHAVLHLLYARFWTKAFADLGLVKFSEPFLRLRSVGMVLAADGKKMSKSLGNIVNPDEVVAEFGADAVRVYEMFMGPWDQAISWNSRSLIGCRRFIEKIWEQARQDVMDAWEKTDSKLVVELNKVIKKVGEDIVDLKFNTAVAALMKFANTWAEVKTGLNQHDLKRLIRILAPLVPFVAEELWWLAGETESVHVSIWPETEEVMEEEPTMVVQVDGRTRQVIQVESMKAKGKSEVEKTALVDEKVRKWVEGKKYKTVFVPGKLINFVLGK